MKRLFAKLPDRVRTTVALLFFYCLGLLPLYAVAALISLFITGEGPLSLFAPLAFIFSGFVAYQFFRNGLIARSSDRVEASILVAVGILILATLTYVYWNIG